VRGAWALAPAGARRDLIALAASTTGDEAWLARLALTAPEQRSVLRGMDAVALAERLVAARTPSQIAAVLEDQPVEAVALAGAQGAGQQARLWLDRLRDVRLEITGDDLLAAGASEGPALGRALRVTLDRKLDGELDGRDAELAAALAALADD
jgi:hypothetical protein